MSTSSIMRWKAWAAFLRPKGILKNSNSPKGVIIAVLAISTSAIGIWWNPLTRSITENTRLPWRLAAKSCMCGTGYLSSLVATLRAR